MTSYEDPRNPADERAPECLVCFNVQTREDDVDEDGVCEECREEARRRMPEDDEAPPRGRLSALDWRLRWEER